VLAESGVLGEGENSQGEKKWGEGNFLRPSPHFLKASKTLWASLDSQAYVVGSVPPISVILAPSLIVPPGPTP